MSSPIVPCLWLDDQAEQAAAFYAQAFGEGRVLAVTHYPKSTSNPGGKPPGSVLTVEFEVAGQRFSALNGGPLFSIGPSISFFVHFETVDSAERLFNVLTVGGEVLMPFEAYPWSLGYGWVQDRYGVSWQVMTLPREPGAAMVVPCLMFSGAQHLKAEAAMQHYTRIFSQSKITAMERYAAAEGPEGSVKHGRFVIAGQEMVAMDSHLEHNATFSEGLSLQVLCADQREVDAYWNALCEGGEPSQCGWLKDRFGVSWQIVPASMDAWMTSKDEAARERVFECMLGMQKLDVQKLQRAFEG